MTSHSPGFEDLLPSGGVPSSKREGSSSALPVGFQLAEFQIERVLGEGGFGIVYLALDRQLGRQVAIKEYMPNSLAGRQRDLHVTVRTDRYRETFELGRRSFINEARLLAHFDHPALVKVLRFWEDRGTAYMAMPFYQARTLKDVLRSMPPHPPEAWLRSLWDPMLDALAHLHTENCFHRDIAPDNILVLPSGLPLLIDFGAARQVIGDATQALTVILKPGFAPVEQYAESASMRQGAWTDIYALAAVMYHAISGKAPPPAVARLVHDEMVPASQLGAGRYSAAFLHAIDVCLAVRPDQRPQRIAAVRTLLQAAPPAAAPSAPLPDDFLRDEDATVILPSAADVPKQGPSGWHVPAEEDDVTVTGPMPSLPASLPRSAPPPYAAPPQAPAPSAGPERKPAPRIAAQAPVAAPAHAARRGPVDDRPFRPPGAPARSPVGKVLAGMALVGGVGVGAWWGLSHSGGGRPLAAALEARAVGLLGLEPTAAGPRASASAPGAVVDAAASRAEASSVSAAPSEAARPVATEVLTPPALSPSAVALPAGLLPPAVDAYAALERVVASSDTAWPIQARMGRPTVTLGQGVQLTVDSAVGGYVYVLQAVPGSKRVELLFPNRADSRNRIEPGASLSLPRKGWRWPAVAPLGERRAVVVVTRSERRFNEALENPAGAAPAGFDVSALPADPAHWPGAPDCPSSDLACVGRYGAAVLDFAVAAAPKRVELEPELEKIVIPRTGEAGPDDIPTPALSGNYPPAANARPPAEKAAEAAATPIIERVIETPQHAPVVQPHAADKPPELPAPRARRMDECAELIRRAHSGSEDAAVAKEQLKDLRCE